MNVSLKVKETPKIKVIECPFCGYTLIPTKPSKGVEVTCPKCKRKYTA